MRKYFISVIIIVALSFMACGDYLDQVPEKDVETFESIFERRASADIWLTQATEFMAGVSFSGFGSNAGVVGRMSLLPEIIFAITIRPNYLILRTVCK